MRLFVFLFCCLAIVLNSSVLFAQAENTSPSRIFAVDYPPFNHLDSDGKPRGSTVEVLDTAFPEWELDRIMAFMPPKRAIQMAKTGPRTCMVALTKSDHWINDFNFIGPINHGGLGLFTRKSFLANEPRLLDEAFYETQQVVTLSARTYEDAVSEHMKDKIIQVPTEDGAMKLLLSGRVKYWIGGLSGGPRFAENAGITDLMLVDVKLKTDLFMACSKDIPDDEIEYWQQRLEE